MAKTFVWILGLVLVTVWTVVCGIVGFVLRWGGDVAANNADLVPVDPESIEFLSHMARLTSNLGTWMIGFIWLVVALIMLLSTWFVGRLMNDNSKLLRKPDQQARL